MENITDKKITYCIVPISLYETFYNNLDKIFNRKQVRVFLPYNFKSYQPSYEYIKSRGYIEFLTKAEAVLTNIESRKQKQTFKIGSVSLDKSELNALAIDLSLNEIGWYEEKLKYAKDRIPASNDVVFITDERIKLSSIEKRNIDNELHIAYEGAKTRNLKISEVSLQDLDKIKGNETLFSNYATILTQDYTNHLIVCPQYLFPIVSEVMDNLGLRGANLPYHFDSIINTLYSKMGIYRQLPKNKLELTNYIDKLKSNSVLTDVNESMNYYISNLKNSNGIVLITDDDKEPFILQILTIAKQLNLPIIQISTKTLYKEFLGNCSSKNKTFKIS